MVKDLGQAREQAVHGSGGIPIPGGVEGALRDRVWGWVGHVGAWTW